MAVKQVGLNLTRGGIAQCMTTLVAKQGEQNVLQHRGKYRPCLGVLVIWIGK